MSEVVPAPVSSQPTPAGAASPVAAKDEPTASDRLAASRSRLRSAMMTIAHPPKHESLFTGGMGNLGSNLRKRAHELPGLDLVIAGVESWWRQSSARSAAVVAGEASKKLVAPIARQRPGSTVLVAVGLGVLLALSKPWRVLLRPALLLGLFFQIALHTVKEATIKSSVRSLVPSTRAKTKG